MEDEFVYTNDARQSTSGFDPVKGYAEFINNHGAEITFVTARVFFLNAARCKAGLKNRPERQMPITFDKWVVVVFNNHFPANRNNVIGDNDLTLHRISGYLARFIHNQYRDARADDRELIQSLIINPIAEANGVTWREGYKIYLSFFPGTEMFLDTFDFYPLTISLYKVKNDMMPIQFLKKALRQRYGDKTADIWMTTHKREIQASLKEISALPWGKAGLSQMAKNFLAEFGIKE
ncbi:N [Termeil virus]|uniref:Nucleoprotein n=1 Tax=Termeil virus TaxID=2748250 RepID=A0A7D9MVT3_9VIRU|nr:N [Termeil virus] [Termeil virus]QLA47015.1 N [Termeil virus] [Termeil virus]